MRITGIADIIVPIASSIRNAYIDFSQMTASVVAIFTDATRDGKPLVGFGFNSNGRYAPQGCCASASSRASRAQRRPTSSTRAGFSIRRNAGTL